MAKKKPTNRCSFEGCKRNRSQRYMHCEGHRTKITIGRFLGYIYTQMNKRVRGTSGTKRPDLYLGLPILPRDVFITWSKNHPDFLSMYKRWFSSGFDRKLTPSVNRMNSSKGYILGNIEWMTNSQNCGLSGMVKSMNQKKAIYELLGVNK